jgi:hypothetical protein
LEQPEGLKAFGKALAARELQYDLVWAPNASFSWRLPVKRIRNILIHPDPAFYVNIDPVPASYFDLDSDSAVSVRS